MKYDDLQKVVDNIKSNLDDTQSAMISDDLLSIMSNYKNTLDEVDTKEKEIKSLQNEKEELLKVNGKLFQRIGFDDKGTNATGTPTPEESKEEKISINDIINDKGDMI